MPEGVKKKYIELKIGSARHLPAMDPNRKSDPFVRVKLNGKDIAKTSIVNKNRFPVWNESFKFDLDGPFHTFVLDVEDDDISKNDLIGRVTVQVAELAIVKGRKIIRWQPIWQPILCDDSPGTVTREVHENDGDMTVSAKNMKSEIYIEIRYIGE